MPNVWDAVKLHFERFVRNDPKLFILATSGLLAALRGKSSIPNDIGIDLRCHDGESFHLIDLLSLQLI